MSDDFLTRRQWNELFQLIRQREFDPSLFEKTLGDGGFTGFDESQVPTVAFKGSNFVFSVGQHFDPRRGWVEELFDIASRPGENSRYERERGITWLAVTEKFARWLWYLRQEVEEPDLWAELEANRRALAAPSPRDNAPFTPDELRQLRAELDHILGAVLTSLQLTADQGTTVRADLDYLKEAAGRVGRRDWTSLVIGTLGSWVLGSVLPASKVSEIWAQYFIPVLQSISNLAQRLPQLGP